jgi:hypothetical protein
LITLRRSRPNRLECLTLRQKRTSRKRYKNGGDVGTGVYMWEETASRVMAADRPYGEFHDFYSVSPEYFGLNLVLPTCSTCPVHHVSDLCIQFSLCGAELRLTLQYFSLLPTCFKVFFKLPLMSFIHCGFTLSFSSLSKTLTVRFM